MDEPRDDGSALTALRDLLGELPGLVSDRVQLLALELKRAARALSHMLALVVVAAVLLCTAWLALWTGLAVAAVQAGLPWGWVLTAVVLINIAAGVLALQRALALSGLVALPATVRRLTASRPPAPPHEPDAVATAADGRLAS
jgi:Putative Actinobacterial Holin-X, holin superfamily III